VRVGLAAGHARGRSAPAHGRVPAWLSVVPPNPSGSDETISRGREVGLKRTPAIKSLGSNNGLSSYLPMTNPVNAAIYAFGGFMLFALAIGFFAAPV
jgi:hypothetical protein